MCRIHYKQFITTRGLKHGRFNEDPPHDHYLKYKIKIEKNLHKDKQT